MLFWQKTTFFFLMCGCVFSSFSLSPQHGSLSNTRASHKCSFFPGVMSHNIGSLYDDPTRHVSVCSGSRGVG